jgi:hypothetical protein
LVDQGGFSVEPSDDILGLVYVLLALCFCFSIWRLVWRSDADRPIHWSLFGFALFVTVASATYNVLLGIVVGAIFFLILLGFSVAILSGSLGSDSFGPASTSGYYDNQERIQKERDAFRRKEQKDYEKDRESARYYGKDDPY